MYIIINCKVIVFIIQCIAYCIFSDPQMPFSSNGYHPADGRMDVVDENVEVSIS